MTVAKITATDSGSDWERRARYPGLVDSGLPWLALAMIGTTLFFWSGIVSLTAAWSLPEYSHGFFIPPIALYLYLNRLAKARGLVDATAPRRGAGVWFIAIGLIVGLLGNLSHIRDLITYGLIVVIAGVIFVALGSRRAWQVSPGVAYLVFMLPLPNLIYLPFSVKLQIISSQIGVAGIQFMGIPVFLDGNVIDLGNYQLLVGEACSGLRYLFPLMSFGFLIAVVYEGAVWKKILLFVSAFPIAVLMNCFRISMIGFLVYHYGIAQAEGFLHFFEGWVIFVACVAFLYVEAALLQRLASRPKAIGAMLDLSPGVVAEHVDGLLRFRRTPALVLASAAILIAGVAWHFGPSRPAVALERTPLAQFPLQLESWRGEWQGLDAVTERVLAADDYLLVNYRSAASGDAINLLVAFYKIQTEGSGIHSPQVCIPGGGWDVSAWTTVETGVLMHSGKGLSVNRAIIQKGLYRQLVYYWFEERGRSQTNEYVAKAYSLLDSITRQRTDGALVRVVTPVRVDEAIATADKRLSQFLALTVDRLPAYVPE